MMESLKQWWFPQYNPRQRPAVQPSQSKIYWFECIGMFVFVYLQLCTKASIGIHLQITFILMIAIPMCAKISGAHYNPAVTISFYLCRYNKNKFTWGIMWTYFKAQLYTATLALAVGYVLNDGRLAGLALPNAEVNLFRIFLSETISTALLVFYTQLIANPETSFTKNDLQKYAFIIAYVFVARKTAYVSSFAINPAITMATVVMDIVTCHFQYQIICWTYLAGDFLGAILGTYVYNKFYAENLQYVRRQKQGHRPGENLETDHLIPSISRIDSNLREQSVGFSKNLLELQKFQSSHSNSN